LRRNVPGATCVLVNNKEVFVRLLAAVLMLACLALLAVPAQAAEATRTLDQSLPVSPGAAFAVLNLAGTLTVVPAPGPAVRVKATVHAESDDLAASVSLATVTGKDGTPTLRVEYPVDRHDEFRYPPRGGGSDSGFDYAGRRVRVSGSRGVLLYADLVVEVPAGAGKGRLETHAGAIQADHMDGSLRFETGSGSIQISHSKGDIVGDTGSGDVVALDVHGSFRCETGSGDCRVEGFEGDQLGCDTGSGAILVSRATARTLSLDTGSGRVRLGAIEAEEVKVDTGSGSVEIEVVGDRLRRLVADTGTGAGRLRGQGEPRQRGPALRLFRRRENRKAERGRGLPAGRSPHRDQGGHRQRRARDRARPLAGYQK
jgi:hypothetical protein